MNKFDVQSRKVERIFIKRIRNNPSFFTGKGNLNHIEKVTKRTIYIVGKRSRNSQRISRENFRRAISFLLYKKTATRKDLESYSNFNSSLMGLLRLALIEIAKIHRTVRNLLRLTIVGVRFFFSGLDRTISDLTAIKRNQAMFILCSYYYLREKEKKGTLEKWLNDIRSAGLKLLIDSGAFSVFEAQKKGKDIEPISLENYANFINRYKDLIYDFFNLDVIGDAKASDANHETLKQLTSLSPIPVWHCNFYNWKESDWDELKRIVSEDHALIGLGGTKELGKRAGVPYSEEVKRRLFEEVFRRFPKQNFHWLGGSSNLLLAFPFFSADSTGWLQGRKKHQVYVLQKKSTAIFAHWSKNKCIDFNINMLKSLEEKTIERKLSND